jgi:hypothetical protein
LIYVFSSEILCKIILKQKVSWACIKNINLFENSKQVSSFGTKEMKLQDGQLCVIPEVVRTTCHSTLVNMYLAFCREIDFMPLSRSSLFHLLSICPASRRTNLRGLDNITTDGGNAVDTLLSLVTSLEQYYLDNEHTTELKECQANLKSSKIYLKTDFKLHLQDKDPCPDHCLSFALSDQSEKLLQNACGHAHDMECDKCNTVTETIDCIRNLILGLTG